MALDNQRHECHQTSCSHAEYQQARAANAK
jgi:hypothetical protein